MSTYGMVSSMGVMALRLLVLVWSKKNVPLR